MLRLGVINLGETFGRLWISTGTKQQSEKTESCWCEYVHFARRISLPGLIITVTCLTRQWTGTAARKFQQAKFTPVWEVRVHFGRYFRGSLVQPVQTVGDAAHDPTPPAGQTPKTRLDFSDPGHALVLRHLNTINQPPCGRNTLLYSSTLPPSLLPAQSLVNAK